MVQLFFTGVLLSLYSSHQNRYGYVYCYHGRAFVFLMFAADAWNNNQVEFGDTIAEVSMNTSLLCKVFIANVVGHFKLLTND